MLRILLAICLLVAVTTGLAQTRPAEFRQMVEQLKKEPLNDALREQIIKAAQAMRPAPAVPEEARRFMARGAAAFEMARSPSDFGNAVAEFEKARDAVPWWEAPYFNLAAAAEKLAAARDGALKDAVANYRWYLLAAPGATDAEATRTKLYKLEYMAEQKEKQAQAEAARKTWAVETARQLSAFIGQGAVVRTASCDAGERAGLQLPNGAYYPRCSAQDVDAGRWYPFTVTGTAAAAPSAAEPSAVEFRVKVGNNKPWTFLARESDNAGSETVSLRLPGSGQTVRVPQVWSCEDRTERMCATPVRIRFGTHADHTLLQVIGICSADVCYRTLYEFGR